MRLPLLAELAVLAGSAALVRCTAMADTQPGSDTDAEAVLLYDPPILRAQFLPSNEPGKVDSRSVLDLLLGRRQTCNAGYGYCRELGICCPNSDRCCSYGYCLQPGTTCCPNGPCGSGKTCCGYNHCHPVGTACCGDESYCEAGNICVLYPGITGDVCCTNTRCTAYVTNGVTVSRTTTATRTATQAVYTYYYFYITWTYYVYYWYYSVAIAASVVTSSITTTTSTVSVRATASAAAASAFQDISATFSRVTPASATSLASLAGSTSFVGGGGGGAATRTSFTFSTPTFAGGGPGGGSPFGANAASRRTGPWADRALMCFFAASGVVAVMMMVL